MRKIEILLVILVIAFVGLLYVSQTRHSESRAKCDTLGGSYISTERKCFDMKELK